MHRIRQLDQKPEFCRARLSLACRILRAHSSEEILFVLDFCSSQRVLLFVLLVRTIHIRPGRPLQSPLVMATASQLWLQKELSLRQRKRGCHLVTSEVVSAVNDELAQIKVGICHVFIMHTSAVRLRLANLFQTVAHAANKIPLLSSS